MNGRTTLALGRIEAAKITLIHKVGYSKVKYIDEFTILSIILKCHKARMVIRGTTLIVRIEDEDTIYSLSQIDLQLLQLLSPVKPILSKDTTGYFIEFNLNPIVLKIYHRNPNHIYIHIKGIRQSNHLNTPILYLLD